MELSGGVLTAPCGLQAPWGMTVTDMLPASALSGWIETSLAQDTPPDPQGKFVFSVSLQNLSLWSLQ